MLDQGSRVALKFEVMYVTSWTACDSDSVCMVSVILKYGAVWGVIKINIKIF